MFCKLGKWKRSCVKKWNYRYEIIHTPEVESVEERIEKAVEQRNDAEMHALFDDGKLRQWKFPLHPACYRDYMKSVRYDENISKEEEVKERFSKVIEFVKSNIVE